MKVLLDENLDHALRKLLGAHEIVTASYARWAGLKNGELLRAAEENGSTFASLAIRRLSTSKTS